MTISLITPFQITGGRIGATSDITAQIEQKIVNVLTTGRFERVGIPDFGGGVSQLLFEPIDDLISADFKVDAMNELVNRISGIIVVDLRVTVVDQSEATITVFYKLPLASIRQVTFRVTQPGALNEETGL